MLGHAERNLTKNSDSILADREELRMTVLMSKHVWLHVQQLM
jgi:hypothetical protein